MCASEYVAVGLLVVSLLCVDAAVVKGNRGMKKLK